MKYKLLNKTNVILLLILLAATALRFYHLSFQSLWLDELHTMNESDPVWSWKELFNYLNTCDVHPPLFYLLERWSFYFFGHTEWVARCIPAIAGVLSVWAIFKLGKEILNEELGLIAAALLCVNYFNIYYSQEARGYMLLWLFTTLSYYYFIRFFKHNKQADKVGWVLFTVLLLYSHYFSWMVLISQYVLCLLFIALQSRERLKLFKRFFMPLLSINLLYLPQVQNFKALSRVHSFWIDPVKPDFFIHYISEYFGGIARLNYLLALFAVVYGVAVIVTLKKRKALLGEALPFSFLFVFTSIFVSLAIPYIRSIMVVPMLVPRYTVIVIPSLIIMLAYGICLIPYSALRYTLLGLFLFFSLKGLLIDKQYYTRPVKTQFREMTQFVCQESRVYPLINEVTSWQQQFYLAKYSYKGKVLSGKKIDLLDSLQHSNNPIYSIDTFWIVGAHMDHIDSATDVVLQKHFVLLKKQAYIDAWAKLYAKPLAK